MAESWVRIGHSLNEAEKQYVTSRRDTVQQCLKKNGITCTLEEVPNIALIASGGGERAMVALLGSLLQLGKEGLLDCMMYLAGVSGSTWCMASLYKELNWSSKPSVTDAIVTRLGSGSLPWEEMKAQLKKYYSEYYSNYSLTHFWSAMIVPVIVKEIDENVLSAQRGRDSSDPYPIYTMIDKTVDQQDAKNKTVSENVWFEMTPSEAGYSLAGAFVDQAHFGSEFSEGTEIKPVSEIDMSYVQGVCGSALASLQQVLDHIKNLLQHLECICHGCKVLQTLVDLHIQALKEDGKYPELQAQTLNKLLEGKLDRTGNEVILDPNNKTLEKAVWMAKLKAHTLHVCECFSDWAKDWSKDCLLAAGAKNLNLDTETRDYEDAGILQNSPYFAVLRKDRNIDLIISLDFSNGNPIKTLEEASRMSKLMGISFPHVRLPGNADVSPDPYYVCPGDPKSKIPTVIHMPLFNMKNCDDLECICHGCKVLQTLVDLHIQALKEDGKYPELQAQTLNKLLEGKLDRTGNEVILDPNNKTLEKAVWMAKLKAHTLHVCECFSDWAKDWSKDCLLVAGAKNLNLDTETRDYEDAGILQNSPYFAVLRKDRNIDLIISLDFSNGNPIKTLEEASRMSKLMGISFPHVRLPDNPGVSPDPYYVCPGDPKSKIPTVIHMPLFNMKNCDGSQQVLEQNKKKYGTFQLPYSPEMISDLMELAQMNVTKAKDTLLEEMEKAKKVPI